ncbi:MAG: hypothetical protein HUJ56_07330 [Erysipelotrichaceae bacterium]|nr:hypothetical protein [Erysipelotrichaceae bacterium]
MLLKDAETIVNFLEQQDSNTIFTLLEVMHILHITTQQPIQLHLRVITLIERHQKIQLCFLPSYELPYKVPFTIKR